MSNPIGELASQMSRKTSPNRAFLVGIDGLGGSGKSVLAKEIRQELEKKGVLADIVHHDDFYLPSGSRSLQPADLKPIGGDFDWGRFSEQILKPLKSGLSAKYRRYDWPSDRLAEEREVQPRGVILIEGVYSTRTELREFYDFLIWVDCPAEERLRRGLARDGESMRSIWTTEWIPAEDQYYKEQRPDTFAHLIVDGTTGRSISCRKY